MADINEGPCVTSLVFKVRSVASALYKALGGFATNGINMTKLESYMVGGSFKAAQFYADIEGHPESPAMRDAGKPQEGQSKYSTDYKGAKWYFQTQANRDLFRANPTAFEPQYGGYCAWAVAKGKLAKGSPKHWFVEDGKLYLNFNRKCYFLGRLFLSQ